MSKMALLPYFWDDMYTKRPSHLLDRHAVAHLNHEDLLGSFIPTERFVIVPHSYRRPWRSQAGEKDTGSEIAIDEDKFQASLDVQHFKPEEITVKITGDNTVTVEGKHEEKEDEHGFICRQFVRRYILPKGHDIQQITSKLSSDGILTITAPRMDVPAVEERKIPIEQTGAPAKPVAVEDKQKSVEINKNL